MTNSTKRILSTIILLTVISFALKAQTNVSGGIYSNTIWTKANSPYIVTAAIVVYPGITLTIEPGVTVKFADGTGLEIRQASVTAWGTVADSITFTSNSPSPTPGIWGEIDLNGDSSAAFNYCNFLYATSAIGAWVDTLTIKNSNFTYNTVGLLLNSAQPALIDTCNFRNYRNGIDGNGNGPTNPTVNHCIFINNNFGIGDHGGNMDGGEFNNCIIDSNQTGVAIQAIDGVSCSFQNCMINNNQTGIWVGGDYSIENCIISNNQTAINCEPSHNTIIKNCTIDSNSTMGVNFGGGSLIGCRIISNGTAVLYYYVDGIITMNVIEKNTIGINNEGEDNASIYCNKICNNISYDFKNNTANNIIIANNYWCSTDSATIASHIIDGYDSVPLGLVTFMPLDTIGCYLTGCDLHLSSTVTNATCDSCHNGQATLNISNGHPNYTYTWYTSPIQYTQKATGLASGTYTVCITDGNGCTACTSVFVDSSNCTGFAITANGTNATCITCTDGFAWVHVSNGTAPYTYSWYTSPLQNTDTAINLLDGSYAVCVTDLYGCAACDSVTIGTGSCSAHFDLYPDTSALHTYIAVNRA